MYANGMDYLFDEVLVKPEKGIEFLSNYFIVDVLESMFRCRFKLKHQYGNVQHQIFIINYINSFFQSQENGFELQLEPFIRILNALRSLNSAVREVAFETLIVLRDSEQLKYKMLINKLLRRQKEILMDKL